MIGSCRHLMGWTVAPQVEDSDCARAYGQPEVIRRVRPVVLIVLYYYTSGMQYNHLRVVQVCHTISVLLPIKGRTCNQTLLALGPPR